MLRRARQWCKQPPSGLGTSVTPTCVGPEWWMAEGAAPTFPLPVRRDPVLARLWKASSVLHDQLQLLLLCPFPPGAAFIRCEAFILWEPSHPASSWLNDRPIKGKPIKSRCNNSVRACCLPVFLTHEPGPMGGSAFGGRRRQRHPQSLWTSFHALLWGSVI